MNEKKIFITGVTGFVGRHLAEYFHKQGFVVYGLVRNQKKFLDANISFVKPISGDLNNFPQHLLKEVSFIIHTAGLITAKNKNQYYEVNTAGTKNLAEAVRKYAPDKRLLYISSLAAAGPANIYPRTEVDTEEPVSHYGKSKFLGEKEIEKAVTHFTILRPPVLFGPYDRGMFIPFQYAIKYGIAPVVGGSTSKVDFLFIDDFVKACFQAIHSPATDGKKYFLGGNPLYWKEFWNIVKETSGKKLKHISIPVTFVKGLGYVNDVLKNSMLNSDKVKEIICPNWTSGSEEAKNDFGFKRQTDNFTAIRMTYQWYKQKGWL
ncbi:MAG: NAD(P)-dependent oxidoreductase [Bacteroidota bacterium]